MLYSLTIFGTHLHGKLDPYPANAIETPNMSISKHTSGSISITQHRHEIVRYILI